jgi:hypothetical protein
LFASLLPRDWSITDFHVKKGIGAGNGPSNAKNPVSRRMQSSSITWVKCARRSQELLAASVDAAPAAAIEAGDASNGGRDPAARPIEGEG